MEATKINMGDKLINFFRSRQFVLYVALFSVLWLTPNTYYVYVSFSAFESPYKELAGTGVALIVAASIMIYTIRKSEKIAYYYSLFEMSISAYYYIQIIGWDWALIPALSFTVMLPISVKGYTKEIDEDLEVKEPKAMPLGQTANPIRVSTIEESIANMKAMESNMELPLPTENLNKYVAEITPPIPKHEPESNSYRIATPEVKPFNPFDSI